MSAAKAITPSRLVIVACFVGVSACGSVMERPARAVSSSGPFVEANTTAELAAKLAPHMQIYKPEGEGPFPTVIQFHGCGGLTGPEGVDQPIMEEYAKAANSVGVAAVVVDSFTHREITREEALARVCSGRRLRGAERAGDVLAALDHVRDLDFVDADRIVLAGWSHGGWSVMDLLSMDLQNRRPGGLRDVPEDMMDGVAGAYLTYPYSGFLARTRKLGWEWPVQARFVLAGEDQTADGESTRAAAAEVFQSGAPVEVVTYDGATHAFDERYHEPDSLAVYDEELAGAAREAYAQWLQKVLIEQDQADAGAALVFLATRGNPVGDTVYAKLEAEADAANGDADDAAFSSASVGAGATYIVRPGDTLSGIAQEAWGDGGAYLALFEANAETIEDPDRIFPGQVLIVPLKS